MNTALLKDILREIRKTLGRFLSILLIVALGVAFLGFIDNYLLLCAAVAVIGIGVATFHPSAGKLANIFAGKKVGRE